MSPTTLTMTQLAKAAQDAADAEREAWAELNTARQVTLVALEAHNAAVRARVADPKAPLKVPLSTLAGDVTKALTALAAVEAKYGL